MWDLPMSCNYFLDPNFLGKAWSLSEPIFYLLSLSSKFTFCFLLYEVGSVSLKQFSFASTMLSLVNRDYQEDIARRVFPTSANALIRLAPAAHTASLTPNFPVGGFYLVRHLQYMELSSPQKPTASLGMHPPRGVLQQSISSFLQHPESKFQRIDSQLVQPASIATSLLFSEPPPCPLRQFLDLSSVLYPVELFLFYQLFPHYSNPLLS